MPTQPAYSQATQAIPIQPGSKLPWYKNPVDIAVIVLLLILYIGANYWLFYSYKIDKKLFPSLAKKPASTSTKTRVGTNTPTADGTTAPAQEDKAKAKQASQAKQEKKSTIPEPPKNTTYACDPEGVCNIYDFPVKKGCPAYYTTSHCDNECGDPKLRCAK